MSYIPTEWKTGDKITAQRLNKLESGLAEVSGGGSTGEMIVHLEERDTEPMLELNDIEMSAYQEAPGFYRAEGTIDEVIDIPDGATLYVNSTAYPLTDMGDSNYGYNVTGGGEKDDPDQPAYMLHLGIGEGQTTWNFIADSDLSGDDVTILMGTGETVIVADKTPAEIATAYFAGARVVLELLTEGDDTARLAPEVSYVYRSGSSVEIYAIAPITMDGSPVLLGFAYSGGAWSMVQTELSAGGGTETSELVVPITLTSETTFNLPSGLTGDDLYDAFAANRSVTIRLTYPTGTRQAYHVTAAGHDTEKSVYNFEALSANNLGRIEVLHAEIHEETASGGFTVSNFGE